MHLILLIDVLHIMTLFLSLQNGLNALSNKGYLSGKEAHWVSEILILMIKSLVYSSKPVLLRLMLQLLLTSEREKRVTATCFILLIIRSVIFIVLFQSSKHFIINNKHKTHKRTRQIQNTHHSSQTIMVSQSNIQSEVRIGLYMHLPQQSYR